jgi:alpha-glucosidase
MNEQTASADGPGDSAAAHAGPEAAGADSTPSAPPWWRGAVFYQIYPRSFADSNGDGEGDLPGIVEHLDHVASLGVDAIWLSPFYPSPMADGGYDVADPRDVDPRFGTLADFANLVRAAHDRGIRVIVDVVPNHVSVEHPWFRAALEAPPGSPEHARFHIRAGRGPGGEEPPTNWIGVFYGPTWTPLPTGARDDEGRLLWYLHVFDSSQPDLNWDNPEILEDSLHTLRFWLDLGVDGFRVDVAFGLKKDMTYADHPDPEGVIRAIRLDLADGVERDPDPRMVLRTAPFFDRDEVHEVYRAWRRLLDSYPRDLVTVAEAWAYPVSRTMDYARSDELHQVFNFDFMVVAWDAGAITRVVRSVLDAVALVGAPPTWVLSNHDTPRVATRMGSGESGKRRALAIAHVAHVLPGGVYVFAGEELGLPDATIPDDRRQDPIWFRSGGTDPGRDGARVPMPWSGEEPPYGFTTGPDSWLPSPAGWGELTVAVQDADADSPLNTYRRLIALRHLHPAFADPDAAVDLRELGGVLTVERLAPQPLWCVLNTTDAAVSVPLPVADESSVGLLSWSDPEISWHDGLLHLPAESAGWVG